jgi:hypothetical protein
LRHFTSLSVGERPFLTEEGAVAIRNIPELIPLQHVTTMMKKTTCRELGCSHANTQVELGPKHLKAGPTQSSATKALAAQN